MSKEQPNNPLHGIKLATMLEQLYVEYGWEELGDILNINAFKKNPTYKSSLKFLRTTPWARAKVEKLYLKTMIEKKRAYEWTKGGGSNEPTRDNIHLAQSWIVSQYKHEYNPWHTHSGHFSGVIYLKIPDDMNKEYDKEFKDHYPASGLIEFMYGEKADFRSDNLKFKPEVGTMLVFPSWLKHSVYPFYVDGERRSMSFNAHMFVPE